MLLCKLLLKEVNELLLLGDVRLLLVLLLLFGSKKQTNNGLKKIS